MPKSLSENEGWGNRLKESFKKISQMRSRPYLYLDSKKASLYNDVDEAAGNFEH